MRFFSLGGSVSELAAARHLRQVGFVRVEADGEPGCARSLLGDGFMRIPRSVECKIALPIDLDRRRHSWRKSLRRSMEQWHAAGLHLRLGTVASLGQDFVIERLYFPILVPDLYARGISPYGAHNLQAFRRLATPDVFVALVQRGDDIVGGGLLAPRTYGQGEEISLGGAARLAGRGVEGLMYVLRSALAACRRAFLYHLCAAFASIDVNILSLGQDLAWMDGRYLPVFREKLRWADEIVANPGSPDVFLGVQPGEVNPAYGMVVFSLDDGTCRLHALDQAGLAWRARLAPVLPRCALYDPGMSEAEHSPEQRKHLQQRIEACHA